jgi:RNA polymerase sigma-70 factor (sigma-E family)
LPRAPDGFEEFVGVRGQALLRTGWLLTGDWASAEDLVQTALARTWPRWTRLRRDGDPEAYVRRVMVNTYASWWRRRWRGEQPTGELPDRADGHDVGEAVAIQLAVRSALDRLTRRQRAMVVLRMFDDLSVAEVAEVLGCSEGTVKSTTSQALAKLRSDPELASLVKEAR